MEAIFIIGIIFGSISAIIIVPFWLRSQERMRVQETLRAAIESGQAMPTEVSGKRRAQHQYPPGSERPAATCGPASSWLGVGLGFVAMGIALGYEEPESTIPMIAVAAFPVFIGLAFIALALINRTKS